MQMGHESMMVLLYVGLLVKRDLDGVSGFEKLVPRNEMQMGLEKVIRLTFFRLKMENVRFEEQEGAAEQRSDLLLPSLSSRWY